MASRPARRYAVRPSTAADLLLLEAALPSRGLDVHARHHSAAETGETVHLVVWADEEPVGTGVIWWAGHRFPRGGSVSAVYPELRNLGVATAWQGRGAGTALVQAAVDTDVLETTTYDYPDEDGVLRQITETDRLLRLDF